MMHLDQLDRGLLVRNGQRLDLRIRPEFKEVPDETRLAFLHRVAAAGTKATNRAVGVDYAAIEAERRGMTSPTENNPVRKPEDPHSI